MSYCSRYKNKLFIYPCICIHFQKNNVFSCTKTLAPALGNSWRHPCSQFKESTNYSSCPSLPVIGFATFTLNADANNTGPGTLLPQHHENYETVTAYAEWPRTKKERNHGMTGKELFALVSAMERFAPHRQWNVSHLIDKHFAAKIDHSPFKWLKNVKETENTASTHV